MGLFRPATTVTSPSGDFWELYVSKTALPAWKGTDADDINPAGMNATEFGLLELPVMVLATIWANLIVPLARIAVLLPLAVARGHRSRAVRIEAVTMYPQRQVLLWTTTDAYRQQVLDEIVAGLAQGKVVQPAYAVYSGAE